MILNKPYLQLSKLGEKKYRLSILAKIPDNYDLGPFSVTKVEEGESQVFKVTALRMSVPGQIHAGPKEQMIWLYDVLDEAEIEVRIETPLIPPLMAGKGRELDLKASEEVESYYLGKTVVLASKADDREGDDEHNNSNQNPPPTPPPPSA
ncbi:MAG: hypothetical protein R3B93_20700 [Bacteroidia bacterium]